MGFGKGAIFVELFEAANAMERKLVERSKEMRLPVMGSLELLPLCNMNCDMCYVRLSREEMEQKGRLRSAEEWLEIGRQMKEAGVLFLLLTGGEPFLYPEFERLYLGLRKMGLVLTINSNGTLIDEELARFLGRQKPRRVNITLYGASDRTYEELCHFPEGFKRAINGIRLLRANGVDVKIAGSLTWANRYEMEEILAVGENLGVPVRIDTYMMPATRERSLPYRFPSRVEPEEAAEVRIWALRREMGEDLFCRYRQQIREEMREDVRMETLEGARMSCYAGRCSFAVNWQGKMRPCVMMTRPEVTVFDRGFDAAWKEIVEEIDQIVLSARCSGCHLRPLCRTCAASALAETGDYAGVPEYMCRYAERSARLLEREFPGE